MTTEHEEEFPLPIMDNSPGKPLKENTKCSICQEPGDGYHFGAEACRACAAFFRRSVSLGKKYSCRGDGRCEITANIRCMCRACRFTKCIEVGMNPAGVQQRRDNLGKREKEMGDCSTAGTLSQPLKEDEPCPTTSCPCPLVSELPQSCAEQMPILLKMRANYGKMDNARLVIHRKDGQSLFKDKAPKSVTYKEAAEQGVREVSLVADWIAGCFENFSHLEIEQKKILFRNFYTPFCLLEGAFLGHINGTSKAVILPSGDYIDIERLDTFFHDTGAEQPMTKEEIEKSSRLFKPSFDLHKRSIVEPMMAFNVNVYEFFALATILFWDFGFDEQTEECVKLGKTVKDRVMRELTVYLRTVSKIDEPAVRVATIMSLLPALQRSVRRFQEDIELTHVFNIYAPPEDFYNVVNGKFM